jgi:arginyl-tRNA synthetase
VITGDLDRALASEVSSAGTWRPAPPGAVCRLRACTTTVAFRPAGGHDGPGTVAAGLAARLAGLDWVAATVTGGGYLTVTVTADALARLAVRVTEAGQGCARGSALAGTAVTAPAALDLPSAHTWEQARWRVHASITGRLAEAAGAVVTWADDDAERMAATHPVPDARPRRVADAIAYAGADAIACALARMPPWGPARVDARSAAAQRLENPAYAVRYAHALAASTVRQAADLGLDRGEAAGFGPRLLAHPCGQALLDELSWLPERVAGAARRRPDVLARFLAGLALSYLDGQETCPAVRPGEWRPGCGWPRRRGRRCVPGSACSAWTRPTGSEPGGAPTASIRKPISRKVP